MDKETKRGVVIVLLIVAVVLTLWGVDAWRRYHNPFVYEKHLEDTIVTVDGRRVSLRELGYYVYTVETQIDQQARIYNPEDPLDYWNTYFNSGVEGGYISEMAKDAVLGTCVCDLIYEQMAKEQGWELSGEEKEKAGQQAEFLYAKLSESQRQKTGLTVQLVTEVLQRKALVANFAAEYFENVDFTGYSGYREELVSYAGEYYQKEILSQHKIEYNDDLAQELHIGRVTTNYVSKY